MSIDTYGKIKGHISPEQIAQTIRDKFGVEVTVDVHKHVHEKLDDLDWTFRNYGDSDYWWDEFGYIEFELSGEKRSLFYSSLKRLTSVLDVGVLLSELLKQSFLHLADGLTIMIVIAFRTVRSKRNN